MRGGAKPVAEILATNPGGMAEHGRYCNAWRGGHRRAAVCGQRRTPVTSLGRPRRGFLGPAHGPFLPNKAGGVKEDMTLNGISWTDSMADAVAGAVRSTTPGCRYQTTDGGLDAFNQQALAMLTSTGAEARTSIRKIPLRDRYGAAATKQHGSHKLLDDFRWPAVWWKPGRVV